ncbi:PHD and RING finger domain-containing protein 1 [Papilio xuthus]|uniref:PHD and RING finger domain-containing protein 1 n=1 Tax=Papilio xuthus TaxID=66420 RepID=A0A194QE99_PAPXU|nr:PHD and RING finger domain-containing protein 1 [Papilio xuthus]
MSEEDSEGSPVRFKRKTKTVGVLTSSSESDSDDSIGVADTRRKRLRVLSDEESASGSDSSVAVGGVRRRELCKLRYSDDESDISGWTTDDSNAAKTLPTPHKPAAQTSGFASDSSEGNSDKCSICLLRFKDQEVGTPENCDHIFCVDCISEWAKNVNTCPVDRITFNSIIVKTHAGGSVIRSDPVKVLPRRSSSDILILEDSTYCEVCSSPDNEETMLLCDGCDRGYHMQCLTPPLTTVPLSQWLCSLCQILLEAENTSDLDDLEAIRSRRLRRNLRATPRNYDTIEEPSTSSGRSNVHINEPTTSRGTSTSQRRSRYSRRSSGTQRRKRKLKTNADVDRQNRNKKLKKLKKKRKTRRQPRTAARRSHVRASVRAQLVNLKITSNDIRIYSSPSETQNLSSLRQRAGITSLSLFGNDYELDHFTDDEQDNSSGLMTAVMRPTSNMLSAYRQARRKMVSIPSPPQTSTAPDILSSIIESQTLLYSKNSIVSVSVDGSIDIQLQRNKNNSLPKNNSNPTKSDDKVDLSKGEDASKKAPSYPGQSRGGGWGGGYRGNYHREQNSNFNRGNYDNNYGGNYQNQRQGNINYQNNNMRRDESDNFGNYARRPPQYSHNDDSFYDRQGPNRRQIPNDANRGQHYGPHQRLNDQGPGRYSLGPSWQSFPMGSGPRPENPTTHNRHSFGGFENPLDMRMGQAPYPAQINSNNLYSRSETVVNKSQTPDYQPLPEPPMFNFSKMSEPEKSEDERSDSGLVIDTEKYDPTEPTNDDDSCEDDKTQTKSVSLPGLPALPALPGLPAQPAAENSPPPTPATVQNILAGIDTSTMNVPHNILDSAVRQVLKEHRNLLSSPKLQSNVTNNDKSDDESDGDCPNFSIYSATSVHIANTSNNLPVEVAKEVPQDDLEDLVQEDDDVPPPDLTPNEALNTSVMNNKPLTDNSISNKPHYSSSESSIKKKTDEEYKEKVSKRCPITTNTRNPIKIKLNKHSLIKRHLNLYDEEDTYEETETVDKCEIVDKTETVDKSEMSGKFVSSVRETTPEEKPEENANMNMDKNEEKSVDETNNQICKDTNISEDNKDAEASPLTPTFDEPGIEKDKDSDLENAEKAEINNETATEEAKELEEEAEELPTELLSKDTDANNSELGKSDSEKSDNEVHSDDEDSEDEICLKVHSPEKDSAPEKEGVEKMTESISETEDERSYTPCLDENKSKDTSLENEKEKGIEGLDTEMISEEEGNEMFSENEKAPSETSLTSPVRTQPAAVQEEKVSVKKKETKGEDRDDNKKKKKKESKKEARDKNKNKHKKADISFKKLSKSGKERNYRERDKDEKSKNKKDRRESSETAEEKQKRRKEKRKDLERYDVRTVVTEKRKKLKDAFGRDISPRLRSTSLSPLEDPSPSRTRRSFSRSRRSVSRGRKSLSRIRRSPSRGRKSPSRNRRSLSRARKSPSRSRRSPSRVRKSPSRGRRSRSLGRKSPSRGRLSVPRVRGSPLRARNSPLRGRNSQLRVRRSASRGRRSPSSVILRRARVSLSPRSATPRISPRRSPCRSPRRSPERKRRRSVSAPPRASPRRRRSLSRGRKRRRSASRSPKPKPTKKKKRSRSERPSSRRRSPRQKSPKRKKNKRPTISRSPEPAPLRPVAAEWSPPSVDSRLLSPRTPPPDLSPDPCQLRVIVAADDKRKRKEKRRRDPDRLRHKRIRDAVGPSKEVFTSGDNILVSVSFKDQERDEQGEKRKRRETKREKRKRKRTTVPPEAETAKPVAIIDLERSPFRELTPSPKNVIVLSDSDHGEKEETEPRERREVGVVRPAEAENTAVVEPLPSAPPAGPKTPPEPEAPPEPAASPHSAASPASAASARSPDAYDPYEPTRSPSASPGGGAASGGGSMTLEAAQRTNLSADEVLARRPLSPIEKVLALLQSTREEAPEPPPGPETEAPPRVMLPEVPRATPKLFVGKAEPIKSQPVKPMARREDEQADSPYSPGSSDFGDLFEPPAPSGPPSLGGKRDIFDALFDKPPSKQRKNKSSAAKVPVKLNKKKGIKTQVGVKLDEDNLKILDDLPSSAVEMQVKSKFLKKLNRQERVVEEVKLVLKPHYNKKHVTKDEYKDILRRAVPKICHNKSGEINPTKIQALVEAYVKKFRKKHKLGLA